MVAVSAESGQGIGAGQGTAGQVLVCYDMLRLTRGRLSRGAAR